VQWEGLRPILQDLADRTTRIEQFLAASGIQVPGQPAGDFGQVADSVPGAFESGGSALGGVATTSHGINPGTNFQVESTIPAYIVQMAQSGKVIQAIKEYRDVVPGIGLKEAKLIIEQAAIRGY
jgi:hypothetical protein